jgi:hypothetical protein
VGRKGEPLTVEQVLAWAEAHKARTGGWPKQRSGGVPEAAGLTWHYIDDVLRRGHLGLPGGDSLARDPAPPFHRPWTPEEDELVRTLPAKEAAQRTGRSLRVVYARRHALGVTGGWRC